MKIGILGHVAEKINIFDGQTVKTREIVKELNRNGISVDVHDTFYIKQNKITLLLNLFHLFKNNDIIIICLSWNGYHKVLPLIAVFQFLFNRRLFDFVIGGKRQCQLKNNILITKLEKMFERIYVESPLIVTEYNDLGIYNVEFMPNFKSLNLVDEVKTNSNSIMKLCTCSRICKEKGIKEAIDAVVEVNRNSSEIICELTIYGIPDEGDEEWFKALLKNSPSYIKYGYLIPSNQTVEYLQNMDVLLFPTYHGNEGFPGTIIDAYSSGLAVIASDWNLNRELVGEDIGFLVPIKNSTAIAKKIIYLYNNKNILFDFKRNSLKKAKLYSTESVMRSFIELIQN